MADIQTTSFSETASSNNAAPPDGMPEGQSAASVNDSVREIMGAIKREYNRSHPTQTSTGTGSAYVIALTVSPPAYTQGLTFSFRAHADSVAACTVTPGTLAAKAIQEQAPTALGALRAAAIKAGQLVTVSYDTTADALILMTPPAPLATAGGLASAIGVGISLPGDSTQTYLYFAQLFNGSGAYTANQLAGLAAGGTVLNAGVPAQFWTGFYLRIR